MRRHSLGFAYPYELEPDDLIEWDHRAARVIEVRLVPEVDWTDEDQDRGQWGSAPFHLTIQLVGEQRRRHYRYRRGLHRMLRVLPEHYPVCVVDGALMPCAHAREEQAVAELNRELDAMCGHCQQVIPNGHTVIRVRHFDADGKVAGTSRYHGAKRHRGCRAAGVAALHEREPESVQLRWFS